MRMDDDFFSVAMTIPFVAEERRCHQPTYSQNARVNIDL